MSYYHQFISPIREIMLQENDPKSCATYDKMYAYLKRRFQSPEVELAAHRLLRAKKPVIDVIEGIFKAALHD